MHFYERHIGDYYRKAGRLNILQHGVYTLLMDACYDREQFPTLEEAIDWVWADTEEEIQAVQFVLKKFFKLNEAGVYVQNHIEEDLMAYKAFLDKQKENGKKGGRPPKKKPEPENTTSSQEDLGKDGLNIDSQENLTETQNNPIKPKESLNHITTKPSNQEPLNQYKYTFDLGFVNTHLKTMGATQITQVDIDKLQPEFELYYADKPMKDNVALVKLVQWIKRNQDTPSKKQTPSKQENVNRWANYGQRVDQANLVDVTPEGSVKGILHV